MGRSKDLATGETRFVNTAGDTMTGDLTISSTAGQLKLTDTDGTEQNTTIKQSGGNVFIQARDNTNNAGIVFAGNGGGNYDEHMRINASGQVTKPNQPSFGAYQATANYTQGSGYGKMIADGTRWNEGSHYSTTNSRFTAPIAGVYHFSAHVNCYSIADDNLFGIQLYVNGSNHTFGNRIWSRGANDMVVSMSHTIKLDASDYVEVYKYSNDSSHGFSSGATWNTFSGFLVG